MGRAPLLVVVVKPDREPTRADLLAFMEGKIAKWWMPDDVVFVPAIPHTATGKILKSALREQFAGTGFRPRGDGQIVRQGAEARFGYSQPCRCLYEAAS